MGTALTLTDCASLLMQSLLRLGQGDQATTLPALAILSESRYSEPTFAIGLARYLSRL